MRTRWPALAGAFFCLQLGIGFADPALSQLRSFGFGDSAAANPCAEVLQGRDGALYGTVPLGGNAGQGAVYRVNQDGSGFRLLKSFGNASGDGTRPVAALIEGSDGALYGTTGGGGTLGFGTVFRLSEDGSTYNVLWNFTGADDGAYPEARLLEASDGFLYGTTSGGSTNDYGVVFRLAKDGSGFQPLFQFSGTNGANPEGGLVEASDGRLYGTTVGGNIVTSSSASSLAGTVFSLDKSGTNFTLLWSFFRTAPPGQSSVQQTNGYAPYGNLVEGADGRLYGTTAFGDTNGNGTVYAIGKDGTGFQILYQFPASSTTGGRLPVAGLLLASDGWLYGTTSDGGTTNGGTLFRLHQDGSSYTVLQNLNTVQGPAAALTEGSDGALYGTAPLGGASGAGALFKLNKDGSGFTVLTSFSPSGGDGQSPYAAPTLASDGRLYGTTRLGGSQGVGSVYSLRYDGQGYTPIVSLSSSNAGPMFPVAPVIEAKNGLLYGTSGFGGSANMGTILTVPKTGGALNVLYSFNPNLSVGGQEPRAGLLQASDGMLYGTTVLAPGSYPGELFQADPNGSSFKVLMTFSHFNGTNSPGALPVQGVIEASNHVLYGTTYEGGFYGTSYLGGTTYGVIYRDNGTSFSVLKVFTNAVTEGACPASPLLEASDGSLYGTTYGGGATNNAGTLFRIAKDGSGFQTVLSFTGLNGDARHPCGKLVQGADGMLYGTTERGGNNNDSGALFTVSTNGTGYAVLASFGGAMGAYPRGGLTVGPDGALYGTTDQGGTLGLGTVFRYGQTIGAITGLSLSAGVATLTCLGAAGTNYWVERTDTLGPMAAWTPFYSTNAPANGQFSVQDQGPLPATGFYRMRR